MPLQRIIYHSTATRAITDDELAPHFGAYRRFGVVADPYAREQGTAITVGLRPDSMVLGLVQREWRTALAAWEGPAPKR